MIDDLELMTFRDRDEWREWLTSHHRDSTEAWLVIFKKGVREGSLSLDEAVEEVLGKSEGGGSRQAWQCAKDDPYDCSEKNKEDREGIKEECDEAARDVIENRKDTEVLKEGLQACALVRNLVHLTAPR